mmetsp:Transcript_9257/g.30608  ORF Transcript_9257/g.30608 Transcript_9257/m.30608 type:complete len:227 (+) Transcript_9257:268-948(+)
MDCASSTQSKATPSSVMGRLGGGGGRGGSGAGAAVLACAIGGAGGGRWNWFWKPFIEGSACSDCSCMACMACRDCGACGCMSMKGCPGPMRRGSGGGNDMPPMTTLPGSGRADMSDLTSSCLAFAICSVSLLSSPSWLCVMLADMDLPSGSIRCRVTSAACSMAFSRSDRCWPVPNSLSPMTTVMTNGLMFFCRKPGAPSLKRAQYLCSAIMAVKLVSASNFFFFS